MVPGVSNVGEALASFDLEPLRARCVRRLGWSASHAAEVLGEYRRFVELRLAMNDYDGSRLSPPFPVDQMYHMHVLDTIGYEAFCAAVCPPGVFLHHDVDGDLDPSARRRRVAAVRLAYEARFGRAPPAALWYFDAPSDSSGTEDDASGATGGLTTTTAAAAASAAGTRDRSAAGGAAAAAEGGTANVEPLVPEPEPARRAKRARTGAQRSQIFVKTLIGKTLAIDVASDTTIATIMERVSEAEGTPLHHQRLIYAGKQLSCSACCSTCPAQFHLQDRTVSDYNIRKYSTLHLIRKPFRGC